jgi:DNA-binding MarR family transcriptional regulator
MTGKKSVADNMPITSDFGYELWRLFAYTYRLYNNVYIRQLRQCGLSPETAATLSAIYQMDHDPHPVDLARLAKRKPQTMTTMLNKLLKRGLIEKYTDEQRKNTSRERLTKKGETAYNKAININLYRQILSILPEDKSVLFREFLEELLKNIGRFSRK